MRSGEGGPFGAVVVLHGTIIARGNNRVLIDNDPTAHAEVVAIRRACQALGSFQLEDCELYTSCEPCPMCLGAIYWARPSIVYYANDKHDAAAIAFDDSFIYNELSVPHQQRTIPFIKTANTDAVKVFEEWAALQNKTQY
jgi:tRNA(Arg) A34 adenosine deaminase TadA